MRSTIHILPAESILDVYPLVLIMLLSRLLEPLPRAIFAAFRLPFGLQHQQLHLLKPFFRTLFGGRSFQNP
jgi:hypothetical protein